jgi:PKD repeat protein
VLESGVEDAAAVMEKVDRITALYTELASGRLDVKSISDELGAFVDLLERLDRGERWKEVLRVARCLSMLLALAGRWLELLRSLRLALKAAERLGDPLEEAWALHELGTLHLAAGRHADADRLLSSAREIRARCRDHHAVDVTDGNLQTLCRALRRLLHQRGPRRALEAVLRRPSFALLAAAALLAAGGTAGAVIAHSHPTNDRPRFHPAIVTFSFAPGAPHVGQSIAFRATASDPLDPAVSYTWRWGDGDPTSEREQRHTYSRTGRYTVTLTATDAGGRVIGQVDRTVIVQRPPAAGPNAAFSVRPRSPVVLQPASFDASSSYDPQGAIARYQWSFGDGQHGEGVQAHNTYGRAGLYTVSLTIIDKLQRQSTLTQTVAVSAGRERQAVAITLTCAPSSPLIGEAVTVAGAVTPARSGVTVKLLYTGPRGAEPAETVTTNAAGSYQHTATPKTVGRWSVQSSTSGSQDYLPSTSEACPFSVENRPISGQSDQAIQEKQQEELRLKQAQKAQEEEQREERKREEERERSTEARLPEAPQ